MTEGLRERKKQRTREAIADAAMRLFAERGFDAVTVADVARAADVSEKTVFNYFPAKEDLALAGSVERQAALLEAVRMRPAGASLAEPFRAATLAFIDRLEREPVESILAVPRLVRASRSLRERLFVAWEEEAAQLAPLIAAEVGDAADDLATGIVARMLTWTHRMAFRAAVTRLLGGEEPGGVAADLRVQAERAYDMIEGGLRALDVDAG